MNSSTSEDETSQECGTSEAKTGIGSLPAKSRERYLKTYELFIEWKTMKGFKTFSEAVFVAYFKDLAKTRQASTLWSTYSMLRATVSVNNNIHINTYSKLVAFLRVLVKGYIAKKTKVLSAQDVETFIKDAPDETYLAIKVALIFGMAGACRNVELIKLRPNDIQKHSDRVMLVNIMKTPTMVGRSFVIRGEYVKIVEKYQALRAPRTEINRFFVNYQRGKCTRQAIGRNTISIFPRKIASFLNLPNPELYRGHCMRTSATRLAKSGADVVMLRQFGRYKSNVVADLGKPSNKRLSSDPTWRPPRSMLSEETQQHESSVRDRKIKVQHCESLLDERQRIKTRWSESMGDETEFVKTDDGDPFDLIPEEYEMAPSPPPAPPPPPRAPRRPLYLSVRQLAALERRRLRLDEVRARQLHARETERLRVEARRLEVDAERTRALARIADVAMAWLERLKGNGYMAPRY